MGLNTPQGGSRVIRGLDQLSLDARVSLAREVLRRLRGLATTAFVDGFSDVRPLPPDAAEALAKIRGRAPLERRLLRRARRTFMAVPLAMGEAEDFALVLSFAPYSIHTEVTGNDGSTVVLLHDTSDAIELRSDAATMAAVARDLPAGLVLEP